MFGDEERMATKEGYGGYLVLLCMRFEVAFLEVVADEKLVVVMRLGDEVVHLGLVISIR